MLSTRDILHSRLKVKRWEKKIHYENSNHKRAGIVILILDKTDFKTHITGDKERYFMMVKSQ